MAANTKEATDPLVDVITGPVNDPVTDISTDPVKPADRVTVRVLSDINLSGIIYKSGQCAEVDSELVDSLIKNGVVDDNPDAIAYALSQL